ncbi:MAG: hypothetical protein F6J94_25780 [Moorea sp. SIO1F2]|uniref:hypothetical protein n=1 Tax=Moorena sp. SIO1F2 TaxID=2607819 RepID=UPI0013BD0F4E|nr:hypothetical protein [Moorena sp. SIO1F2]NET85199.1 hypothetical protein [Moorena sp. SIO1F2]
MLYSFRSNEVHIIVTRFPIPDSRFPIPDSLFTIPCSLKPRTLYLTKLRTAIS